MTTQTPAKIDQAFIDAFSTKANEPDWFHKFRLDALEKYNTLPMPKPDKTKIDRWDFVSFQKYTAEEKAFSSLNELPEEVKSLVEVEHGVKNVYIQHNQTPAFLQISDELKEKGVIFTDLFTAVKEHGELVQKYFMTKAVKVDEHKLTAFHAALVNGGAFLYVPKNVEIKEPIQSIFIHTDADAPLINHVLIVADDHSSVTYVENYISIGVEGKGVANVIAEVVANTNATINFGAVDTLSEGLTTYVNRRGYVGRDSRVEWALGMMNSGDTIFDNTTLLIGDGSIGNTKTVAIGTGNQTQNFTTKVVHFGKASEGFILNHGVVKDKATTIFNGIGKIEHKASKANAQQESRLLMLNKDARGDANPILLIDEDDVMAGHAASVGRVDPLQLYYLMSRGISREEAERLVIHGFLAPVVTQLPIEGVKSQLKAVIERKIM